MTGQDHDDVAGAGRGLTRRRFVQGAAAVGGAVGLGGLLAACGDSGDGASTASTAAASDTTPATSAAGGASSSQSEPSTSGPAATSEAAPTEAVATTEADAPSGGTLRVGMNDGGSSETLNPLFLPTFMETGRSGQLYDRLMQFSSAGTYEPWLAESIEANADATVWQVKLRDGVTFHDGKPFGADDVLWTMKWISDPASKSESQAQMEPIDLAATKKVSDTEIELHLKRPIGDLAALLGIKAFFIVPDGKKDGWEQPNGTGPFKLEEWTAGQQTTLSRNAEYWNGPAHVDTVILQTIADPAQRTNALKAGQVDAISFLDFVQAKALEGDPSLQIVRAAGSVCVPLYMQVDADPFKDVRVREAFKLAVDREQMVKNVLLDYGQVGNDVFGITYPSYNKDLEQRTYDPERAKSLLAEAGHGDGVKVTLYTSSSLAGMLESATAFKQQAKAAGIDVDLQKIPADNYFANDKYLKVPFYQTNWGSSFESIVQDSMVSGAPYNETNWKDPAFEKRFRDAQGIADDTQRFAAYGELQQQIWAEGGYIIWGFQDLIDAVSPKVQGVEPNSLFNLGYFQLKDWSLSA